MASLITFRTARTRKRCKTGRNRCPLESCTGWIEPGERYRRVALTPHDSDINNREWWTAQDHAVPEDEHPKSVVD